MELILTAIFQNEAPYLKEWIDFHLAQGCEFFYLFDHLSTDHPEKVLEPYKSLVKLIKWPLTYSDVYEWTEVQCLAYERALHWACGKTKWLAILDVDEFLFAPKAPLIDTLNEFEEFGGICANWQVYGTSNIGKIPKKKKLTETLTLKAKTNHVTNHYVKSIVRPERVKEIDNAHSVIYKEGFFQVNTKKKPFQGPISPTVEIDRLRINHYTLRDEHYLRTQKLPRLQKWWPQMKEEEREEKFALMNVVEDLCIGSKGVIATK